MDEPHPWPCLICPRPPPTLTFDRLTLKQVCESHLRWGTFLPNLGTHTLRSGIIRYVRDGRTDKQTDRRMDGQKQRLLSPSLRSGHNNLMTITIITLPFRFAYTTLAPYKCYRLVSTCSSVKSCGEKSTRLTH